MQNQNKQNSGTVAGGIPTCLFAAACAVLVLSGCTGSRALKGGKAVTASKAGGFVQTLVQGANPSAPSRQSQEDIAADYFALRKNYVGQRWVFTESRNLYNPASHCDIAWDGALASEAHFARSTGIGARVG